MGSTREPEPDNGSSSQTRRRRAAALLDTRRVGAGAAVVAGTTTLGLLAGVPAANAASGSGPFCHEYSWPGNVACNGPWHHLRAAIGDAASGAFHCVDMYLDPHNNPHYTAAYCGHGPVGLTGVASSWGYPRLWPQSKCDIWGSMQWGYYG